MSLNYLFYNWYVLLDVGFWWWPFDWSFARPIAPVVTTTSIILSSSETQNGDILVLAYPGCHGKWPLNVCRVSSSSIILSYFFCKLTAFNLLPMSANYGLCQVI